MEDQTLLSMPGETTQMVGSLECPVCSAANTSLSEWCVDCGFRLDSTPGEDLREENLYALTDGVQKYPLKTGENAVGRLNADVFLSDASVSRRHATVLVSEEGIRVRDEGSSNGTFVQESRLEPGVETTAPVGSKIRFGSVTLTLTGPPGEELPEVAVTQDAAAPAESSAADSELFVAALTDGFTQYPLRAGENTIGRRTGNDVVLPDPYVSGRHAAITVRADGANLVDLGSTNGTFWNEVRLTPGETVEITPEGDLRFGQMALKWIWLNTETDADTLGVQDEELPGDAL